MGSITTAVAPAGRYSKTAYVASFVGFAPVKRPRAGRRSGIRQDRVVCAALPWHRAPLSAARVPAAEPLDRGRARGVATYRGTRPLGGHLRRPRDSELRPVFAAAGVRTKAAQWYILNGAFTEITVNSPRELDRNHGIAVRSLEVAAEHDLLGRPLTDLGDRLDLNDHPVAVPRQAGTVAGDPRGARRYLARGRRILAALGVWRWTHVEDWRRTRRWWEEPPVRHALLLWHDRAWQRDLERLACRRAPATACVPPGFSGSMNASLRRIP